MELPGPSSGYTGLGLELGGEGSLKAPVTSLISAIGLRTPDGQFDSDDNPSDDSPR